MLRDIAPELGTFFPVCDDKLKGVPMPCQEQVLDHDPKTGCCRILPEEGETLLMADEKGSGRFSALDFTLRPSMTPTTIRWLKSPLRAVAFHKLHPEFRQNVSSYHSTVCRFWFP